VLQRTILAAAITLFVGVSSTHAESAMNRLSSGAHDADLGEVKIHYVVRGHGPVLLATSPGWGATSSYLQKGLTPLEEVRTVVYVDTRGSGGSSLPANREHMSQSDMADDLDKLREKFGLEHVDVLGHSDGGTIALEYAERHPTHVEKLVLVDPAILGDRDGEAISAMLKLWENDPHYRAAVEEERRGDSSPANPTSDEAFARWLGAIEPLYLADPAHYGPKFAADLKGTHLSAWADHAEDDAVTKAKRDQTKDLKQVTARTLVMNGTVDWVCPYSAAQRLAAGIPGARLSLFANKGHMLWIEDPDRFFAEVKDFLRSGV
jgi:proline iminopeptidase